MISTVKVTAMLMIYVTSIVTITIRAEKVNLGDPPTHNMKCVSLITAPKKILWFCLYCYGTKDAVDERKLLKPRYAYIEVYLLLSVECQDTKWGEQHNYSYLIGRAGQAKPVS